MLKFLAVSVFLVWTFSQSTYAGLAPDAQRAKQRGIELFNQYRAAEPDLRIAAEAGDSEAQYYLAEALRKKNRFINFEASKWYEAAAEQGHYYAMIRLGRSGEDLCAVMDNCTKGRKTPAEWLEHAFNLAKPLAEKDDAEAMYVMYHITGDMDWLVRSAEAGHSIAQYWMAVFTREGHGFFWLPWERSKVVEKWAKASADGGYPRGMMVYVSVLFEKGDMNGARYWTEKAAEAGYQSAVGEYGAYLGHEPDQFGYPLDLVKGYAMILQLRPLDGGGDVQVFVNEMIPLMSARMTPDQIEKAESLAKEWKATHPPVSFFPHELGW